MFSLTKHKTLFCRTDYILLKYKSLEISAIFSQATDTPFQTNPVPGSKNEWSYTSTPPIRLHSVVLSLSTGTVLLLPDGHPVPNQSKLFIHFLKLTDLSGLSILETGLWQGINGDVTDL
jgi:hypothetical protein